MEEGNFLYRKKVSRLKRLQVVLFIGLVLSLLLYLYIVNKPEITSYKVDDICGPIGGVISHPIDDADACSNICGATCLSKGLQLHSSDFLLKDPECNDCTCYCRD